jgi:hypothetical protein
MSAASVLLLNGRVHKLIQAAAPEHH